MNSINLKEKGFNEFLPLDGLLFSCVPQNKCSVLALVDITMSGKPISDILYIGRSKNLTKKVFGGYLAGNGGKTTRRISGLLLDDGYLQKVAISWMLTDDPKATQQELLQSYQKEHGQFPAWNASKKSAAKPALTPKPAKSRLTRKVPTKPTP